MKRLLVLAFMVSSAALAEENAHEGTLYFQSAGMDLRLEELSRVQGIVWAMDFLDAERLVFTLLNGELGILDLATGEVVWVDGVPEVRPVLGGGPLAQTISGGLFDVLVDPEFASTAVIYLAYVKPVGETDHALALAQAELRGDRLVGTQDIFVAEPAGDWPGRWGTRLIMDKNRYLFVAVGDRRVPDSAQDLGNHLGKLLRLNDDGSVPADNPFVGRRNAAAEIWSYDARSGPERHPLRQSEACWRWRCCNQKRY